MKRFISMILSLAIICTLSVPAFASSVIPAFATDISTTLPQKPENYGEPYEETTYYDEDLQATVTERSYFVPGVQEDGIVPLNDSKGSGWFKNTKEFKWTSGKITTTYAEGYFTWEDGEVSVSQEDGGYDYLPPERKIIEESLEVGSGKYGFIFNNYVYVKYTFKFQNWLGNTEDLSVKVRVSESGNKI